jgi:predicted nucleotidyltransferase component of viral defense system
MVKIDALPENTGRLFRSIQFDSALEDFTLVGGTAISLLVGHRLSMDLDFCTFDETLPSYKINQFIQSLKNREHQVFEVTEPNKKAQFKINTGKNLDDYARDYVIDGVKVTFFAFDADKKTKHFLANQKVLSDWSAFKIMGLEGLFATKSLLPEKRSKSRDLYDLWYLISHEGFTVAEMFEIVERYSSSGIIDHTIYVLTGEFPIDEEADEGLGSVGIKMSLSELYAFFIEAVSKYQQLEAAKG